MRLIQIFLALVLFAAAAVVINHAAIPDHNTAATHFDTLIVLGYPANPDGSPSPDERERVLEAVREYKAGIAPSIIMTGGPAHNRFVEAHVMATYAVSQGIPPSAITEERQAQNTIRTSSTRLRSCVRISGTRRRSSAPPRTSGEPP